MCTKLGIQKEQEQHLKKAVELQLQPVLSLLIISRMAVDRYNLESSNQVQCLQFINKNLCTLLKPNDI